MLAEKKFGVAFSSGRAKSKDTEYYGLQTRLSTKPLPDPFELHGRKCCAGAGARGRSGIHDGESRRRQRIVAHRDRCICCAVIRAHCRAAFQRGSGGKGVLAACSIMSWPSLDASRLPTGCRCNLHISPEEMQQQCVRAVRGALLVAHGLLSGVVN